MKIKLDKKVLVLWPDNKQEEKIAEQMRDEFDDADYNTDRVWNNKQSKKEELLGIRIYLKG